MYSIIWLCLLYCCISSSRARCNNLSNNPKPHVEHNPTDFGYGSQSRTTGNAHSSSLITHFAWQCPVAWCGRCPPITQIRISMIPVLTFGPKGLTGRRCASTWPVLKPGMAKPWRKDLSTRHHSLSNPLFTMDWTRNRHPYPSPSITHHRHNHHRHRLFFLHSSYWKFPDLLSICGFSHSNVGIHLQCSDMAVAPTSRVESTFSSDLMRPGTSSRGTLHTSRGMVALPTNIQQV